MKRLLDQHGGVISTFHYDPDGEKSTVETTQDVEPILERNKALQNQDDGYSPSREWRRIASIPLVVAQQWMKEDGVNWLALPRRERQIYLRRKLRDPQYRYLRTSAGPL